MRKIIHIDMDAFFAAVEIRENPNLRGLPIAVGYDGPRGVVSTASYEARKYGVRSALPIATAKRLCPGLIIVPCNFALYKEVSAQIHDIFHEYTDLVEPLSIDEAFLDVTVNKPGIELARDIAVEIKQKIRDRTGLTASAGVSYNKFLAKIASDYRKPDGLTTVHPSRALEFIGALSIEDFWGVGPKTAERMHQLGIFTGEQLRQQPLPFLTSNFGKAGKIYYDFSRGIDDRAVETERERKSIGCEETFIEDISDEREVTARIDALIEDLMGRLARKEFAGRTLTLKVKYHDFTQITRSITHTSAIETRREIEDAARELLAQVAYGESQRIRLLGITISNPVGEAPSEGIQLTFTFRDYLQ